MRARLAIVAAVGGLALAGAPEALADPIQVVPSEGDAFTARVGQLTFRATVDAITPPAFPNQMNFRVSRSNQAPTGVLSSPIDSFSGGPDATIPPVYQAEPNSDTNWPNKPGTYYWQALYQNCAVFADPNCFSPVRELTIDPLAPPTQTSPEDEATIPYGGEATFSVQDDPSYTRDGTRIYIEFSKGTDLSPDGTFANEYLLVRPSSVGEGIYEYQAPEPITDWPGTYYWLVERVDCFAEADCDVTDGEIRSFTVAPPVGTPAPKTILTRHPARRTRKRRARFAFVSNLPDASFQCYYTGGWSRCQSPQRFRHLKPGRYRFKVRAVANGKRDPTPASWLFKVIRRHRGRH